MVKNILHKGNAGYDATVIRVYSSLTHLEKSNEKMKTLYEELKSDVASYGNAKATVTGSMVMIYTIMKSLTSSQFSSTAVCIIIAALVVIIAYRKPLLGIFTMLPVIISAIWIMGTMYLMGYSLNVMTVMITSLTIGLGITYAIHVVERFRLIADRTGDVINAVEEAAANTGMAVLMAALTTIAGFSVLIFSPMPPEQQFGLITAITILFSFLTTVLVIPPLLLIWGRWRKRKKGYIISPE
jgi:predicted RND superfamily exporter protein